MSFIHIDRCNLHLSFSSLFRILCEMFTFSINSRFRSFSDMYDWQQLLISIINIFLHLSLTFTVFSFSSGIQVSTAKQNKTTITTNNFLFCPCDLNVRFIDWLTFFSSHSINILDSRLHFLHSHSIDLFSFICFLWNIPRFWSDGTFEQIFFLLLSLEHEKHPNSSFLFCWL